VKRTVREHTEPKETSHEEQEAAAEQPKEQEVREEPQASSPAEDAADEAGSAGADRTDAESFAEPSSESGEGDAAEAGAQEQEAVLAEIEALRRQAEETHQRMLRVQADFDNFRRRTRQEKEEMAKYASLTLITQLLPVLDNFERAMAASRQSDDVEALAKGIEMVYRQLFQVLEQEGLKPIEAVGQPFNPEFHEAVMREDSGEHGEDTVIEELQKGYMLKDKVIRPSMVKVSS
jgi:molecular chaperone GrpE